MNYARLNGELVWASDSEQNFRSWSVRRNLRCPACDEPVTFASGPYQAPHFRHKPGTATFDCENFHPSNYMPAPQPERPDPWQIGQHNHAILPLPERKQDPWTLDFIIRVEFKKSHGVHFILEVRAKNFLEPASAIICSIQGNSREVVFGEETKTLAMLVNPFKPFLKFSSPNHNVQVEVSRFCNFFADHRYFVIKNNLTLLICEEFELGDINAVYDSECEEVLLDVNTQTLIQILNSDGYTQSNDEAVIKVSSIDCKWLSSTQRCMFLSSFENVVASNESDRVLKLDVKALGSGGDELFVGYFDLGKGRHNLDMPFKERAAAYLISSGQVITRLELKVHEALTYPNLQIGGEIDTERSFIVETSSEPLRVSLSGYHWVFNKYVGIGNTVSRKHKFPMTRKEWNMDILGMDYD